MIRCGKQVRLTPAELDLLAIDGIPPRVRTWKDYVRAHERKLDYFSGDTPEEQLLREIFLEDGMRQAKALARENGWQEEK